MDYKTIPTKLPPIRSTIKEIIMEDERLEELKRFILDYTFDENIKLFASPSYSTAFIGLSHDDRAIYDYDKMIEYLVDEKKMSVGDAVDFISYDTERVLSYMGDDAPIILYRMDDWSEQF